MPRLLAALLCGLTTVGEAAPPADIDAVVADLLANGAGPGIAIGIVEGGAVTLTRGYGRRELGRADPVTPGTVFEIGSTTKAFTAAALALLVDEGRLSWDDRVIDHLPKFRMHDPWVTREMTIRDLLTHRSGLGPNAGDLMVIPPNDFARSEMLAALRHFEPRSSFRTEFAYSNILYVAAGEVIESVSGMNWETFVKERLLEPAGMSRTLTVIADRGRLRDRAQAHLRLGPPVQGMGPLEVIPEGRGIAQAIAPAGGIISSADDLVRWVQVQLGRGRLEGRDGAIWDPRRTAEMWSVVSPLPVREPSGPLADAAPRFSGYALGWYVQDYQGEQVILHAGGTFGFTSLVVLLPERDVGFVLLQNGTDMASLRALEFILLDHYLGRERAGWSERFRAARDEGMQRALAVLEESGGNREPPPGTLRSDAIAGTYRDRWYGVATVTPASSGLRLSLTRHAGMTALLEPVSGDTYLAAWENTIMEPALDTFIPDGLGGVERIALRLASPVADPSYGYADLDFRPETP